MLRSKAQARGRSTSRNVEEKKREGRGGEGLRKKLELLVDSVELSDFDCGNRIETRDKGVLQVI